MTSLSLGRRLAITAGGAAIIGVGLLTSGCSTSTKEKEPAPATTTSTSASTSAPAVSPTEKATVVKPTPSLEDRGGMDAHGCPPGQSKYNGVCQ